LPRQFVVHHQRERLLDAATHVFGTRSFAEARVADMLERASISRKTFYEQFTDKEDCFLAAYGAADARAREALGGSARGDVAWDDCVQAGVQALLTFLAGEPEVARLMTVEAIGAGPRAQRRRAETVRALAATLAGVRDGEVPVPAEMAVGGVWEVVHSRVLHGRLDELPGLAGELTECVLAQFEREDDARVATG
jgi:AcrR family transcriptional regulator